ncbi:hypothetical protein TWF694_006111 [Orbilia ellipsospora]|uniref:Integral membrane protein n=1 Tax=Orbilia ellipsospora TaxID=2528407 RepID=A0AAV9WS89_9PEZI
MLSKRYIFLDTQAPDAWDDAAIASIICLVSVTMMGFIAWAFRTHIKWKLNKEFHTDDNFMTLAESSLFRTHVWSYGLAIPIRKLTERKLSLCVTCHRMTSGGIDGKYAVTTVFATCLGLNILCMVILLGAFPPNFSEYDDMAFLTLQSFNYAIIAVISTACDIMCFIIPLIYIKPRFLSKKRISIRRAWMWVTFVTTLISILRGVAILPATTEYSTESMDLVLLGVLELNTGILTTSLPALHVWLDVSREEKEKFRHHQPFKFFHSISWIVVTPIKHWWRQNIKATIDYYSATISSKQYNRRLGRLTHTRYYQRLFQYPGAQPSPEDVNEKTQAKKIIKGLRVWWATMILRLDDKMRRYLGLRLRDTHSSEDSADRLTAENLSRWIDVGNPPLGVEIPMGRDPEEFLTNYNYEILFAGAEGDRDRELNTMQAQQKRFLDSDESSSESDGDFEHLQEPAKPTSKRSTQRSSSAR